jgi:hypothetical protein
MGKVLLGFVIGVALTCFIFLYPSHEAERTESVAIEAAPPDPTAHIPRETGDPGSSESPETSEAQPEATRRAVTAEELLASVGEPGTEEAELRRQLEELQDAYYTARFALEERWAEAIFAAEPVILPSPLRPEFDWIPENLNGNFFHQRFERESIDQMWARTAESAIRGFVSEQTEFIQKYGYPVVECRTTRCVAQFIGYGIREDVSIASDEFNSAMADFYRRLGAEFSCQQGPGEYCTTQMNNEDGVTTIYWGIKRNEE